MKILKNYLTQIINNVIKSVKPKRLIPNSVLLSKNILHIYETELDLHKIKKIYIVGAGKASGLMAAEIERILGDRITNGVVSTNNSAGIKLSKIKLIEAGHPIPNENSLKAGNKILKIAETAKENDLVICLISGGGSALMEALPNDISLEDYKKLSKLLIESGADINEINLIRKSVSQIKGGKLAESIYPAKFVSLILSDVVGDKLETIASAPTYFSSEVNVRLKDILNKYELVDKLSSSIKNYLNQSHKKIDSKKIDNSSNYIIGNNKSALTAAAEISRELGYEPNILNEKLEMDVDEAASSVAESIKEFEKKNQKICLLFGGETTVKVTGSGKGGRNQELALRTLLKLKDINRNFIFASVGTDGVDGPTDAAGAYVDNETFDKIKELGLNPEQFISDNNSYEFFSTLDQHIKMGPTGTNVADIMIALLD